MKKQVINLMMTLAIVFGLSVSAMAQNDGEFPDQTYELAIGSSANFDVDSVAGNTYAWVVYEAAITHTVGATTGLADASGKTTIANPTWASTDIKFYGMPDTDNLFVVEVTEAEPVADGGCSTVRRFYVSVFDFDIEVVAFNVNYDFITMPDLSVPTDAVFTALDTIALEDCNSWSGDVVSNYISDALIQSMQADSTNNASIGENKYTDSYFAIRTTIQGTSTFSDYRARFQWSMDTLNDASIYQIEVVDGPAMFASESASPVTLWTSGAFNAAIDNANLTDWADGTFNSNKTMYIPKQASDPTSVISLVRVRTHNLAGEPDMQFNMKIDRLQLEKSDSGTDDRYNNGEKFNNETNTADTEVARLDTKRDISASITVRQSPETTIIDVTD